MTTPAPRAPRPVRVAAFVGLLAAGQLAALGLQFARGFVPFRRAPGRVPYSWDMFATDIERCDVRWDPPVVVGGRRIASLRDSGLPFEWDRAFASAGWYGAA